MTIKTNWYVITGGPCSGKTTIIERLATLGYTVIPEVARTLINNEIRHGKTKAEIRLNEIAFQEKALQMKIDLEKKFPPEQLAFLDRGVPDSIAYYKNSGKNTDSIIAACQKRRYKGIFFLEPLPYRKDYARIEDKKTTQTLSNLIYEAYIKLDYKVTRVPVMTVGERVQFILNKIKDYD